MERIASQSHLMVKLDIFMVGNLDIPKYKIGIRVNYRKYFNAIVDLLRAILPDKIYVKV